MKNDDEILQSLIAGGLIGAALGALITNNKNDGAEIGAIAGAAILATYKANENAKKTNVLLFVKEDGKLIEIDSSGNKRFIKYLKPGSKVPQHFKLK